ncbi:MAG: hypothetical protein H7Y17_02865 [Chlorobia bacterium]|nr:hypothetical protein [Fimbriimonadaceae bacterium]
MSMTDFQSGLVCPNRLGGFLDPENASRGLTNAIARANATITQEDIDAGLHPLPHGTSHDLRHTCKSILEDMGCPGIARRMILGHAGADAHDRYGKAFDQTIRDYLGTMLSALDKEERLLAVRPEVGVQTLEKSAENSVI